MPGSTSEDESLQQFKNDSVCDANQIAEVKAWLASQFDAVGKDVPEFDYTPHNISHLLTLASHSQANTEAALIVTNDFQLKATEYRSQAARVGEILGIAGLGQETLPTKVAESARVVANTANLLNIRDTSLSSFLLAMGELTLRKNEVAEKRIRLQRDSQLLLRQTRNAITRLANLKRTLVQIEDDASLDEAQMEKWKTNLEVMAAKEKQYARQLANFKELLNRMGYSREISHGALVNMAEHKKELEKKTSPIVNTLRSYHDLPPDKELAGVAIEDKKREFSEAEKYLEDLLQSALLSD